MPNFIFLEGVILTIPGGVGGVVYWGIRQIFPSVPIQEFSFAHPDSILRMNQIYNTHFTGSPLWDLFSDAAVKLENTWNRSIRLMMDIPIETHRRLIQPLSGFLHIRKLLVKRFLKFVAQIGKSTKIVLRSLMLTIKNEVRATTGSNLRKILLQTDKVDLDRLEV